LAFQDIVRTRTHTHTHTHTHIHTIGDEDYVVLQNFPLTFTTSDTRMCVDLQVLQDGVVEMVESLNIVLTSGSGITVDVPSVEVQIIDTDSKLIVVCVTSWSN